MKYFLDFEFEELENRPTEVISMAIVREDGKCLYLENRHYDIDECTNDWIIKNVIPYLWLNQWNVEEYMGYERRWDVIVPLHDFRKKIEEYFSEDDDIEIWGWYCSYDWYLFCKVFGIMMNLPKSFPYFIRDLRQEMDRIPKEDRPQVKRNHNALEDARGIRNAYIEVQKIISQS